MVYGWVAISKRKLLMLSLLALVGCGDPSAGVVTFSAFNVSAEDRPIAAALPSEDELARDDAPLADLVEAPQPSSANIPAAVDAALASLETDVPPEERGLFGWLRRKAIEAQEQSVSTEETVSPVAADATEPDEDKTIELAALEPATKPERVSRARKRSAGIAEDAAFGTRLPFGEVARVCEARSNPLGSKVAKSETRGRVYTIYDSAPKTSGPRSFYVTGFADRCPRQFTAALAMFGSPEMHEMLRYGRPSTQYPYSDTDKAYEKIKSRICKVPARKPCGSRLEDLERGTVFISTYENLSGSGRWADILLHDSAVVAASIKKIGDPTQ